MPSNPVPVDPCALLDREAIAVVQAVELLEARPAERPRDGLRIASCFFRASDYARSVSLELALPGCAPSDRVRPRERWRAMFHAATAERPRPRGSRRMAGAGASPAPASDARGEVVPVAGLGEEAYFVGTAVYGALYVLHDELYFRVSSGGPGDLAANLDRARALARHVISKLPA